MAESNSSSQLDGIAAQLQAKADEVLQSTGTDEEAATAGGKREAMRKVALMVKEQAEKGMDSSKDFLSKVMGQVSAFASEASSTASSQFADAKERGLSHTEAAKEIAGGHFTSAKDAASIHIAGLQTNLNKAIAQGQAQGTASTTSDRAMPADEGSLSFPFNLVAWFVSLCSGKGTTAMSSGTTTSKDFSVESLHNAAAALTESFGQEAQSAGEAKATGSKAGDTAEAAKSSASEEVEASREPSS